MFSYQVAGWSWQDLGLALRSFCPRQGPCLLAPIVLEQIHGSRQPGDQDESFYCAKSKTFSFKAERTNLLDLWPGQVVV